MVIKASSIQRAPSHRICLYDLVDDSGHDFTAISNPELLQFLLKNLSVLVTSNLWPWHACLWRIAASNVIVRGIMLCIFTLQSKQILLSPPFMMTIQCVSFIVPQNTAALSHTKSASAVTSQQSCHDHRHNKRHTVYWTTTNLNLRRDVSIQHNTRWK